LVCATSSLASSEVHHNYASAAFGFLAPGANSLTGTVNGTTQTTSFNVSGLFGLGGDYEYMMDENFSLGGVLRYYNASSTIGTTNYQDTLFGLGADARAYLRVKEFLPYASAGLMFMAPGVTAGSNNFNISSGIGMMMNVGLLYEINETVAVGLETMRLMGLSNSINGNIIEDYMFKGRFAFGN
jgi:hypothetical protein